MGSGFRTFQSGEVLTASNVQNYLMEQSVMTFAGTAALGSAIGTAVEAGMVAYLTDSDQIIHYRADAVQGTAWQAMPMVGVPANVVINGAMQVAQRGTSTTGIVASGYWTADRWNLDIGSLGTWTQSVENDAPTGSGLRKSLRMLCTTADATPAAGDFMLLQTLLEGQNLQQFLKGTSSAKEFTMSFWVKGTTTGTYVVSLYDNDNARNVGRTYTINAANTWEKKTITFPADTTGAFDNDNAQSLRIWFGLGLGTNFTSGTLPATWASYSAANSFAGQTVNLAGATNRSWQITGVQLEAGSVATPFEFEDFLTTVQKCQRYYEKSLNITVAPGTNSLPGSYNVSSGIANLPGPRWATRKRANATVSIFHFNGTADQVYRVTDAAAIAVTSVPNPGEMGTPEVIIASASNPNSYIFHYVASAEL